MPNSTLYSDPFLKQLVTKEPKLAEAFFETISKSKFSNKLAHCLESPSWAVEKLGKEGLKHPNYPRAKLDEFLNSPDLFKESFWEIFESPNLTPDDIAKYSISENPNVHGSALMHEFGDKDRFFDFMSDLLASTESELPTVFTRACWSATLDDRLFQLLVNSHSRIPSTYTGTIGELLWRNKHLTEDQKAFLILAGIEKKTDANSDFWNGLGPTEHYLSSFAYFSKLGFVPGYNDQVENLKSLGSPNSAVIDALTSSGHPIGLLLAEQKDVSTDVSYDALFDLIEPHFLHRLFWTELCERPDFAIYRRNAYRTDDLFIEHPILGREFENAEPSDATRVGGVFIFDQAGEPWLAGTEELSIDSAINEITSYEETMMDICEHVRGNFEDLGACFIALTRYDEEAQLKYGFAFTEKVDDVILEVATAGYIDSDQYDVSAELNPNWNEILSWKALSDFKKEQLFNLLVHGHNIPVDSKMKNDCDHFLGCMALHEATPPHLLKKLKELNMPIVNEVLASR